MVVTRVGCHNRYNKQTINNRSILIIHGDAETYRGLVPPSLNSHQIRMKTRHVIVCFYALEINYAVFSIK